MMDKYKIIRPILLNKLDADLSEKAVCHVNTCISYTDCFYHPMFFSCKEPISQHSFVTVFTIFINMTFSIVYDEGLYYLLHSHDSN
jgi:hypothetical protein